MKIAVLGAGLMGKEVARDLSQSDAVKQVGLADMDVEKAKQVLGQLKSDKLKAFEVNASDYTKLKHFIQGYDVVVNALFYTFNEVVAKAAIDAGVHCVDLGGHIEHITDRVLDLHDEALAKGVTIIPDLGVAPGMINILAGLGVSKLESAQSIKLFVGGIPVKPEPPLEYNHVFSIEGLLDHYSNPALIIKNGSMQQVTALSNVESIYFDQFGPLEAFYTSGGTSTLPKSFPFLETLEYKTIRYPGHAEKFKLLIDLQLASKKEMEVNGVKVRPRDVLVQCLKPILDLKGKQDVVLLRAIVEGVQKGKEKRIEYEMITFNDQKNQVTAMARSTANTISVVAQMIGAKKITKRGVYPPEQIVPGDAYIKEMAKRGVVIKERM